MSIKLGNILGLIFVSASFLFITACSDMSNSHKNGAVMQLKNFDIELTRANVVIEIEELQDDGDVASTTSFSEEAFTQTMVPEVLKVDLSSKEDLLKVSAVINREDFVWTGL